MEMLKQLFDTRVNVFLGDAASASPTTSATKPVDALDRRVRSLSSLLRSRSVKSFAVEVLSIQSSFQPPPVPGLGVQRGQVVLALARHFETCLPQCGDDIGTIPVS